MQKCPNCGTMNEDSAMYCDNCGNPLGAPAGAGVGAAPAGGQENLPPSPAPTPVAQSAASGSLVCWNCGTPNLPGTLYCDNCGADLQRSQAQPQVPPKQVPPQVPQQGGYQPQPFGQPGSFQPLFGSQPPAQARLMVAGQSIAVPQKAEAVIGRADLASGWTPDVDLTPAGGTPENGVSRKHARLSWQGQWMIEDMDATNHTFLRGQQLPPWQKTPIHSGDEIQMGRLRVIFQES